MKEILIDTILDSIKLLPFLFVMFLIIELIEHKSSELYKKKIVESEKFGPVIGGLLGVIPQCGFSVMATNLYVTKIISLGTLMALFLSTSDEMLPLMLAEKLPISFIIKVLLIKLSIGVIFGLIIDFVFSSKKRKIEVPLVCNKEHCDCDHGIIKASIKHTISIFLFIFAASLLLEIGLDLLGEETISNLFMKSSSFGPFISSLVGLIPSCASSVIITQLYISKIITFGSMVSGLLTGSGMAILVLFKTNKNIKDSIKIVLMLYLIGSICGIIIDLLKIAL